MQVKNFEDLEIWKDARLLTKAIYQLTKGVKFAKDFALRDQFAEHLCRSCQTLLKGSNVEVIKNSFSFSISPKHRAGKFARNFTWPWINLMLLRKIVTMRVNLSVVYRL